MTENPSQSKTYRQMVKEHPDETMILMRLLALRPEKIAMIASTAFASIVVKTKSESDVQKLFDFFEKNVREKADGYKMLAEKLKDINRQTCITCGAEFPDDKSGEVPLCIFCLTGIKRS